LIIETTNINVNNPISPIKAFEIAKNYIELKHKTDSTILEFPNKGKHDLGIYNRNEERKYTYTYKFILSAKEKWIEKEAYLMGYSYEFFIDAITAKIYRANDLVLYQFPKCYSCNNLNTTSNSNCNNLSNCQSNICTTSNENENFSLPSYQNYWGGNCLTLSLDKCSTDEDILIGSNNLKQIKTYLADFGDNNLVRV